MAIVNYILYMVYNFKKTIYFYAFYSKNYFYRFFLLCIIFNTSTLYPHSYFDDSSSQYAL
ncbi:hypothetical protein HMPREF1548_06454 [Clostridium sp. KLE 1755]|nr:hypothetical protein HMPREF1548_06454 [Clostridium sp. KLE 1755]